MKIRQITQDGRPYWQVDYATGQWGQRKRRRKTFASETDAKRFAKAKRSELRNYGDQFEGYGPGDRAEMADAFEKAKRHGFTLKG